VTQASAPSWLAATGISTSERGFILVNDNLQSLSHPQVFAAGDIATMKNHPRAKAGVFAVRQGKPLFENLTRSLSGKNLKKYTPQKDYLSLIGTGKGKAIATRGWLTLPPSKLLWHWKDDIDRKFMASFRDLPEMKEGAWDSNQTIQNHFCAGCGSKVGSNVLERVLHRIQESQSIVWGQDIVIG
ncbi:MAG: bifunctional NADH dehydrogenase FAD-containing subunit/selenide, water dikinase SelD, partial [Cyanobacteria bacterium J06627_8]